MSSIIFTAVISVCCMSAVLVVGKESTLDFYKSQCLELCCNTTGLVNVICPYLCADCDALRAANNSKSTPTEKPSLTAIVTGKTATTVPTQLTVPTVKSPVVPTTVVVPTTTFAPVPTTIVVQTTTPIASSGAPAPVATVPTTTAKSTPVETVLPTPVATTATKDDSNSTLQHIFASAYQSVRSDTVVVRSNSSADANVTESNITTTTVAPEATLLASTTSPEDLGLKLCCSFAGVPDSCNICSWEANKTTIVNAGLVCLPYLKQFADCAAEGHNNADCCMTQGVPLTCIGFCNSEIPQMDSTLAVCLDFIPQIFGCHKTAYTSWKVEPIVP